MKIVALLSFYDEQPNDLARLVKSLPLAGVTRLVALDGAYSLFPNAQPASSHAEHQTLRDAAQAAGIHLHLRIPSQPWQGNEIEKRTALFALGEKITTPDDWYLVIDGDEHLTAGDPNLHDQLAISHPDVANITYHDIHADGTRSTTTAPRLFRAIRGLHCFNNHFTYRTPDGRFLWGNARTQQLEPRHPAPDLHMQHEPRSPQRRAQAQTYYVDRDKRGIENGRCEACKERKARHRIYVNYRPDPQPAATSVRYRADTLEVCVYCAPILQQTNLPAIHRLGLDPIEANATEPLGIHA